MEKNLTSEIVKEKLAKAPMFFPVKLASMYSDNLFFLGIIKSTENLFSVQLNKELAEYLYNSLGKFLGKTL